MPLRSILRRDCTLFLSLALATASSTTVTENCLQIASLTVAFTLVAVFG